MTTACLPRVPARNTALRILLAGILGTGVAYAACLLPPVYSAVAIAAVALVLAVRDRLYALCALTACYIVLPVSTTPVLDVGGFSLRVSDLLLAPLFVDSAIRLMRVRSAETTRYIFALLLPVLLFFVYLAMSLLIVAKEHPAGLLPAIASFLRLALMSSLIVVGYTTFTTEARLKKFLLFTICLSIVSVLVGAYQAQLLEGFDLEGRSSGVLGPNQLGVISGLLVLFACVQLKRRILRSGSIGYLLLALGAAGIVFSKSIGAILGTLLAVGLYQLAHMRRDILSVVRVALGIGAAGTIFAVFIVTFRGETVQSLLAMEGGNLMHRVVMAQAGIEIFKQNPLYGVGWNMSSSPQVMGSTDIGRALRLRYYGIDRNLFPDVRTTSVHNMYIQFLAELGVLGALVFVFLVLRLFAVIRRILKELDDDSRLRVYGEYCAFALILLLVRWNATPLYAGQVESFLAFLLLAALGALPNIARRQELSRPAGAQPAHRPAEPGPDH